MYKYSNTIFNQLLSFLPKYRFNQFVGQHQGDRYVKKLTTWNQLIALLYAQATGKKSLRDIELGLRMHEGQWYHLGVGSVAKSSLSYANNNRSYEIFEKLFYALLDQCREITSERSFKFNNPLYSFDSTTIRLCLSVFNWAKYTKEKGALKIHALLNNRTTIPELLNISDGKKGDLSAIKEIDLNLKKGSILVFDRAYIDYQWWDNLDKEEIFFVSRTKSNQNIFVLGQHNPQLEKNIIADEIVMFGDFEGMKKYDKKLRRVKYLDEEQKKEYSYLTNNFELSAKQIADIYKDRWQIELFFKWIKQNLKIKTFLGTSQNAVMTQIWIAMTYYLLVAYIKFQTKFTKSLLELTRMIKETLMMRRNLIDLLSLEVKTLFVLEKQKSPQMSFW
jgi:hypothetical protein